MGKDHLCLSVSLKPMFESLTEMQILFLCYIRILYKCILAQVYNLQFARHMLVDVITQAV